MASSLVASFVLFSLHFSSLCVQLKRNKVNRQFTAMTMIHYTAGKVPAVKMSLKLNNGNGSECYFHLNNGNGGGIGAKTTSYTQARTHTHTPTINNNNI